MGSKSGKMSKINFSVHSLHFSPFPENINFCVKTFTPLFTEHPSCMLLLPFSLTPQLIAITYQNSLLCACLLLGFFPFIVFVSFCLFVCFCKHFHQLQLMQWDAIWEVCQNSCRPYEIHLAGLLCITIDCCVSSWTVMKCLSSCKAMEATVGHTGLVEKAVAKISRRKKGLNINLKRPKIWS